MEKFFTSINKHKLDSDCENIYCLSLSKNNNVPLLATATSDKYITLYKIYDTNKIDKSLSYKYHLLGINKLKFNNDSSFLLSGGNDLLVNMFDLEKHCLFRNFQTDSVVTSFDINYASNLLVIGCYDNYISVFDVRTRNPVTKIVAHSEPITSVKFSEDSTVIFSTSYDTFCRVWDVFKYSCLKTYVLEKSPHLNSVCLLPNQNYILLNAFGGIHEIVNINTEEEVKNFKGNKLEKYPTDCIVYKSKNEKYYIMCGDEDGYICIWDIKGKEDCDKIEIAKNRIINSLDWNNNGLFACASMNEEEKGIYLLKENINYNNNNNDINK